jgi:stage II sporulation protein P
MTAVQKKMDIFGVMILGLTTAVGGGVIRDLILGITPPNMFRNPVYALVAFATAVVVFLPAVRRLLNHSHVVHDIILMVMDAVGLGAFTVVGVQVACESGQPYNLFLLIFVGTLTGVGGGVLRDVMACNTPYIFVKHFYATASIVGAALCAQLQSMGIAAVQATEYHDYPSYNGAYTRALTDIKGWLKKYPSIKLVIDVHRDALMEGSTVYKTMAQIQGNPCAQLMLVAGTDGGNLSHPNWKQNAAFQVQLHHALNTAYPSIMRPMSFRAGRYNQHMTSGSMLVEVGTCGNSLQEALTAGRLFANTLADLLLNG